MACIVIVLDLAILGALVNFIPGDPVSTMLQGYANPELVQNVRKQMRLDEPLPDQIYHFAVDALHGDLGRNFLSQIPVSKLIADNLPNTLILAFAGLSLAVVIGIPLGAYAAAHANGPIDRIIQILTLTFSSMTQFVSGLLLLLIFAVKLQLFPPIGTGKLSDPLDYAWHLALPATALAISWIGYLSRLVRASMIEVLNSPYIRASRGLGIRERTIRYKYALKNATIPTVAILGVGLGHLVGGAIFIEVIFTRPGLGTLVFDAVQVRDYPVVRGALLVVAVLFILANLVADLSYRLLDPRIRVERSSS
jgi:peptide/nickel transport system permease protein